MEFKRRFVMNNNDIVNWFYVDNELIEQSFTNWLQITTTTEQKLKLVMMCQLRCIDKSFKKLKRQHARRISILTPEKVRTIFDKLISIGYTFEIYYRTTPTHEIVYIINAIHSNKYYMQTALKLWRK